MNNDSWDENQLLLFFYFLLIAGAFLMAVVFSIDSGSMHCDLEKMGNMICEERGHGDFVEFKSKDKQIVCEPKEQVEKFDGGTIVVDHEGGG